MRTWIKQYLAVSKNAYVVSLGSPFSLILHLTILACQWFLACLPFFTFGEQLRLIRDQSLALCLIGGCLAASLGACTVLVNDVRRGTASIMMSRPLSSFVYVLGKWTGLAGSVLTIQVTAGLACLWLTKITTFGNNLDVLALCLYAGAIVLALLVIAVKHYLFGGLYVWQANVAVLVCFLSVFLLNLGLSKSGASFLVAKLQREEKI